MNKFWDELKARYGTGLATIAEQADNSAQKEYLQVTDTARLNQLRVLDAFRQTGVSELHLKDGTGYGYGDLGREGLDAVYALTFSAEAALARAQIISGTHAIACALTTFLGKDDRLLSITGRPYDTLARIIGLTGNSGRSLRGLGVHYDEVDVDCNGQPDYDRIRSAVSADTRMVMIQRSRGYSWRPSLPVAEIGRLVAFVKQLNPATICFVDNCYGEFVESDEPTDVDADLIAGSLIKNAGGGLAPSGGYLAGRKDLVTAVADRLIAPGLGNQIGTNLGLGRLFFQGLFQAPHVVGEALKGAVFAAHFLSLLGLETSPEPGQARADIVQAVKMPTREAVLAFCRGIQAASPVDSFAFPEPGALPGYQDQVIMAAGTFVQGSSIELSADAPLRLPYIVYLQGGLSLAHAQIGVVSAAQELEKGGFLTGHGGVQ
ncbi:MAG: methionine gamma-lyase family protein [Thermacetogeniaceae bacterium]